MLNRLFAPRVRNHALPRPFRPRFEALEDRITPTGPGWPIVADPIISGDFNNDGKTDLAVLGANNTVDLFLGNGDGTFQSPLTTPAVQYQPGSFAIGDFNGDGKLDLVLPVESALANADPDAGPDTLVILLGNGDGTFHAPIYYPVIQPDQNFGNLSVATGDLNRDGRDDIVVAWNSSSDPTLPGAGYRSLLSNGDGTFSPLAPIATFGSEITQGRLPDLNEDGRLDLVVGGYLATGNGDGTFMQTSNPGDLGAYADLNGDGHLDSAVMSSPAGTVSTLTDRLGNGNGTFGPPRSFTTVGMGSEQYYAPQLGDFNGDGRLDVLTTVAGTGGPTAVDIMLGNGDGTFSIPWGFRYAGSLQGITVADFNGDGYSDFADIENGQLTIHLNNLNWSTPVYQAFSFTVSGFPSPITAGVSGSFTVTARDLAGNVATSYTGTVGFRSSDPHAALPSSYTFTAADRGMHTFSVTLKTAGTQSISAGDIQSPFGFITGTQTGITVNPAAASTMRLIATSGSYYAYVGVPFSVTVTLYDAYGNVATGYRGTVHFTSSDNRATLPGNYTFTAADAGTHPFTGVILRKKGVQSITVTDTLNALLTYYQTWYVQ